jgi:uroporphyrinogen-III decarboxylase
MIIPDYRDLEQVISNLGDDGLPHCFLTRTPFQQMWVVWVSLEQLILHMMDAPELVEECMDMLGRQLMNIAKAVHNAPIPYVVIGDNITAPAIGLHYFEKYCVPYYNQVADIFADREIPLVVHADGDLKPLWQALGDSKVVGLDSFSPPPDNDTTAAKAVEMWPDKKLMLNFPSSVHLKSEEEIYLMAMEILEQAGHTGRLQIQISENVPPGVWMKSYPQIIKAINDFGKP